MEIWTLTERRAEQVSRIDTLERNYRTTEPLMEGLKVALMALGLLAPELDACTTPAPRGSSGAPGGQQPLQLFPFEQSLPAGKTAIEAAVPPAVAEVVMQLLSERPNRAPISSASW